MSRWLVAILLCLSATASHAGFDWRAGGGEIVLEFNTGMLEPLGVEIEPVDALSMAPPPAASGYLRLRFAGAGDDTLRINAPRLSVEDFSGRLSYRGGFVLKSRGRSADLTGFALVPRDDHPFEFDLVDGDGTPWFRLDHVHYELVDDGHARATAPLQGFSPFGQTALAFPPARATAPLQGFSPFGQTALAFPPALELRHMNLTMLEPMEAFTQTPGVAGQVMGVAHARAPVSERPLPQEPLGACSDPDWATEPGLDNGVTLIALEDASFMRCQDCNGSDGGPVVFAPSARLKNEGTADVPWWLQFSGINPPYDNDQHPFLIWNLYRVDGDGRLEQVAASGLKHAFFSTNTNCPCAGGNTLWTGCEDTYSAANNDSANHLAPRREIVPAEGRWGRCNSFFDPECDGEQSQDSGLDSHLNRLNVMEADIDPAGNPGATYIMEAWYVVRDNSDIFAAMGWREFDADWNNSFWSNSLIEDFVQGPYIDTWADPENPGPGRMNTAVETPQGRFKVAVRTEDLGDGWWRYDYVVANFDYMNATTDGAEPDLEVIENAGIVGVRLPLADPIDIAGVGFARADRTAGQDWSWQRQDGFLEWSDPGDTPLDWGLLFRFSLEARAAPAASMMEIETASESIDNIQVETLAPPLFSDRFEAFGGN